MCSDLTSTHNELEMCSDLTSTHNELEMCSDLSVYMYKHIRFYFAFVIKKILKLQVAKNFPNIETKCIWSQNRCECPEVSVHVQIVHHWCTDVGSDM